MSGRADLRHVDTWLFDLDNTLYPADAAFMGLIEARMTAFVMRAVGLPHDEARVLQKRYFHDHGTTLAGLMAHDGIDPAAFLAEVHDVPLAGLSPDPELGLALAALPGRRLVFTNASAGHAQRVLTHLGLAQLFEDVFHIEAANLIPKPNLATFRRMAERHAITPATTAFFEDMAKNLAPAHALGMTTVLVGSDADASPFVDHRTPALTPFLQRVRTSLEP